jgi:hypothetical protein
MNIPGPLSVSAVNIPHQQELDLRPFQRVTAQVLSMTGTTALLTIEGYPVVAQLTSADQAATLLPHQTAQFVVTQRTNEKITLKIISDDQTQASSARSVPQLPELAMRLLEQQNIPVTANHLIIARALLKKHLPVTPALINELSEVLSAYGSTGSKEAELATMLKSVGLPVNAHSLALASRQAAQIGDSLTRPMTKLTAMSGQDLPEELLKQLDSNLQILSRIVLNAEEEPSRLAKQLKAAVEILGKSLEHVVLERMQNPGAFSGNHLLSLVRLQQSLEQTGKNELANAIDDFLKDLQQNQFLNAKPEQHLGQSEWTEISFPIQSAQQKANEVFASARLRIERERESGSNRINLTYTRLILQVDLEPCQTVEVDLSVVDQQIRTSVTAPDALWCQQAQQDLPALELALKDLGFTLKDVQIDVGEPHSFERLKTSGGTLPMTVDIEA